jgi:enoyl-CoA hydratase/carnithine racemase
VEAGSGEAVERQERDRVLWLTLNRPRALNAVDEALLDGLEGSLVEVESREDLRALVITGAGNAFSVGMDLACLDRGFADHEWFRAFLERFNAALLALERLPVPTVAAVNGLTRAGGFEILLACDLAVCADEARIADNHTPFGVMPGGGATQRAPRRLGMQRAKELIFTGRWLQGQEAEQLGVVLRSVPRERLQATVEELVGHFRDKSRDCLAVAKAVITAGANLDIQAGIRLEMDQFFGYLATSPDAAEGFRAYREHRTPVWRT